VYAFPADLAQPMSAATVATLESFLASHNVPSDGLEASAPFVTALVYIVQIFLLAQFVAGSTNQVVSLFTNGITLASPASASPVLTAAVAVSTQPVQPVQTQSAPASQDAGAGNSGTNPVSASTPFSFSAIPNTATVGQFLSAASQTWAGGAISLGGF
jgi:hypothetical protein